MILAIFGNGEDTKKKGSERESADPGQEEKENIQPENNDDWEYEFEHRSRKTEADDEGDNLRSKGYEEIYRSVSASNRQDDEEDKGPTSKRRPKSNIAYNNDEAKTIGNAWSPFSWYNNFDKKEKRYENEEEEERDKEDAQQAALRTGAGPRDGQQNGEFEEDDERNGAWRSETPNSPMEDKPHNHSYRTMFGSNMSNVHSNGPRRRKTRTRFFRNKGKQNPKNKRKQSVYYGDEEGNDEDNAAYFTGLRAQQLIGSLAAGSPAINILASCLLEDEHGIARAPLLLSLLGLKVSDISKSVNTKNRKFRIDLEYGVGEERLRWNVEKSASDLLYLHSRFKFVNWRHEVVRNKNSELPKVPIPPLRTNNKEKKHAQGNTHEEDDHLKVPSPSHGGGIAGSQSNADNSPQDNESIGSGEHFARLRTYLSSVSSTASLLPDIVKSKMKKNQDYIVQVTNYLNDLIGKISLKPQSNRLFQFFEILPISSLLSYETGFQGKQGIVHIGGTTKSQGWRVGHFKANDLKGMIDRRQEKWLLIRNTYIMYVSDINSTLPLEVFLVDPKFEIKYKKRKADDDDDDEEEEVVNYEDLSISQKLAIDKENGDILSKNNKIFKHLKITLVNSERQLVILPKSTKEQKLWIKSLEEMKNQTPWSEPHRFGSFAPVRDNCFAQWFVDGRDYFWAVSSALEMAKDVIFIHDWWLSPELYLRRPANGNQQFRLDRILQRKAQQGVKIFVIVYRNVGTTVATDSLYTKHSILSLDEENIHVIRSPNQLLQNTYFWAHHEKLCIIDQTVAFLGGIDLCYGRFDTPDHVLVDDSKVTFDSLQEDGRPTTEEHIKFQTFPGKDYSNPRVKDFFGLDKPYESMYDRQAIPRMPWHDIHMVTLGKIASDLARHFVQRWNYLLRQKRPLRFTPLLTPPPDFTDDEIQDMGLGGTCEVQLLRSSCNWSLGLAEHEQSIQNAYLKLIETSEHFVYIENQFFITSCVVDGTEVRNRIGDALVDRIIRAHKEGKPWRAVIVIPLMPGFESQVDEPDGSSVRVIMQCQFLSISRGATSIFAKLKRYGIEPDDYIQFFSLRKWGIIGPDRTLVTEQLYIHAKCMIVDDKAAIIGSANINERSMRGVRDSEVAAVVRDKETVKTTMNGEPYIAGKFAHTLRMRLMREHLGVNVDILEIIERRFSKFEKYASTDAGMEASYTGKFEKRENRILSAMVEIASRDILNQKKGTKLWQKFQNKISDLKEDEIFEGAINEELEAELEAEEEGPTPLSLPISFNNRTGTYEANKGIRDKKKHSYDARVQQNSTHKKDVSGYGPDMYKLKLAKRARLNSAKFLKELAHKAMKKNPTGIFLPNLHEVEEFLESDDADLYTELSKEESESIIAERNKERWLLLKKISYMQRTAAKEKEQRDEEVKKRCAAGLEKYPDVTNNAKTENTNNNVSYLKHENESNGKSHLSANGISVQSGGEHLNLENGPKVSKLSSVSVPQNNGSVPGTGIEESEEEKNDTVQPGGGTVECEDIPIISLDEQGVVDLMQGVNPKAYDNFSTFVDPYGFEDPLDDEFYEDLWFEHARRNTEIYRMIFHTQPDDFVPTWKDYKRYSKLQGAFLLAQKQEAKYKRDNLDRNNRAANGYEENSELSSVDTFNRKSVSSIKMHEFQDVGLLGHPPQKGVPGLETSETKRNKFSRRFSTKDVIPEGNGEVNGEEEDDGQVNERDGREENGYYENKEDEDEDGILVDGELLPSRREESQASESSSDPKATEENFMKSQRRKRRRAGTFTARRRALTGDRIYDRTTAERILTEIQGHLVFFPADWLMRELEGGNWFYNTDRIPPIEIYD